MVVIKSPNGIALVREFVNTRDFERGTDELDTPEALGEWLADNELVDDLVEPSDADLRNAQRVREAIRDLLAVHNEVEADEAAATKTLDEAARSANLCVHFRDGKMVVEPDCDGANAGVGRIVALVADLLDTSEWQRLKACRDETCRYAFYDESRNRSRAWCSMEVCGNREKARSFRARHAG